MFRSCRSVVPLCQRHKDSLKLLSIDGAESTDASIEAISNCTQLLRLTVSFADNLTEKVVDYLKVSIFPKKTRLLTLLWLIEF